MPGARRRGRPRTAWMDNIKMWTGLSVEEPIRMTEDRDNGESTSMVWPTLGSRTAKEQNRSSRIVLGTAHTSDPSSQCRTDDQRVRVQRTNPNLNPLQAD